MTIETLLASISSSECAHVVVPEASEMAMRYYQSGNLLWIVKQFWNLAIPLLFLFSGFSSKLDRFSTKWAKKWVPSLLLYLFCFLLIYQFFDGPLDFYADYLRKHEYGLSNQSLGRWFGNWGKSFLIGFVASAAFIWIFYLLLKKSPKKWWFYGSLVSIAITFFGIFIQPIWIAPLFNHFGPMKNKGLEKDILALAEKAKIEGARVFEVDMSQDTNALNAYVTGLGETKRIVLWDTTVEKLNREQILFVMGHEMGHYVLNHIWMDFVFNFLMTFIGFYLAYRMSNYLLKRYRLRFGFAHLYSFASFPLFLFIFSVITLLFSPLFNLFSRTLERQADRFGLEITQNNEAAGEAFLVLQQQNLGNPRPGMIYTIWRASHPSLGSRIDFCNEYCPWKEERPLKYGHFFQ